MNPGALAIHGYQSIEQVRQHLSQFQKTFECFYLDGRQMPFEEWPMPRSLRGERFTDYEVSIRRKDSGKTSMLSYSGTLVQLDSGQVVLFVNTLRDVTGIWRRGRRNGTVFYWKRQKSLRRWGPGNATCCRIVFA